MAVSADGLRRLAALELTAEQLREVLAVVAESIETTAETRGVNALRQARYRDRKRNEIVTPSVTERNEPVTNVTPPRAPIRERVLNAVESSSIKELPTVARKSDQPIDLFGSPSVRDKRQAKVEEETRIVRFACETWNEMISEFPRMVRITVVPDRGTRERLILAAAKLFAGDLDFPTAEAGFRAFFAKIRASPFLRGDAAPGPGRDRAFKPTIDRLLAPKMLTPIMEDTYGPEVSPKPNNRGNGGYAHAYGR
jgi:hypothetical protein